MGGGTLEISGIKHKISAKHNTGDLLHFLISLAGHGTVEDLQLPPEVRCWSGGGGPGPGSL